MEKGPRLVFLSTTGISDAGRDIPLAMVPLYHWVLFTPHKDKKRMEELVVECERRWVLVRPSLLVDMRQKGPEFVRVGIEVPGVAIEKRVEKKEVGYTITRADVGCWIYEECIKGDGGKWEGKMVSITY
jgi:hypothetical protein